ncbi:MAG: 16S rRNA (cytosine(1402)-N(4))-methyltransferase [Proteobacteria bacterium]|nr:MAG: 16S rRNA (cytosine(1402)-N(4))-methyltransferase [Pseudomonadota bacterium]
MQEHMPVLLAEALEALDVRPGGRYLDATFGRGGHTGAMLERVGPAGRVVAMDRDPAAIAAGRERFASDERLILVNEAFSRLAQVAAQVGLIERFDGVLLDLGVSSPQLEDPARGFSFVHDGPLDMRMDNRAGVTAAQWLARAGEREIARVIREYGEERFAKRIARAIVERRRTAPFERTLDLAAVVAAAVPTREPGKHPATRTFQAIRILVNDELAEIEAALAASLTVLAPGGRLCVISFHSLEDGLVKRFIQRHSQDDPVYAGLPEVPAEARAKLRRIGRAVHPTVQEVQRNPRARSAVMRVAERLAA